MSFQTVSVRLKGVLKGTFLGIQVLRRGVSPRIVAAEVLGSGGATPVSGPELAALLGLEDSWAYFSVRSGTRVTPEPDTSGQAPAVTPAAESSTPVAVGPQGGTRAPGGSGSPSAGPQGGAQASVSSASTATGGTAAE